MFEVIGYLAILLNLISMAMKKLLNLRIFSLIANMLYVIYGLLIDAIPIIIGCAVAVLLHSYHIYKMIIRKVENNME